MDDPYKDPATGLLRNLLGHTDAVALEASEADISAAELVLLRLRPLPGDYDLRHLQRFHQRIFRSVYPWAGEIRTVAIAKTDLFCLPQHIRPYADTVFAELAAEKHLRELPRDRFVDRLTHFYAEVNAIHPFREGNGRTRSSVSSAVLPAGHWPGPIWTENETSQPPSHLCAATMARCTTCWTAWSTEMMVSGCDESHERWPTKKLLVRL